MRRTRRRVISTAPQKNVEVEPGSYVVDLQGQWRLSTTIANPDSSLYDGVYESFSNKGQHYSAAIMRIYINGLTEFKFYIRSYAEGAYDYVVVSNLDCNLSSGTTSGTNVKVTSSTNNTSGITIDSYQLVEFTGIDGGVHFITVMYRKDSSSSQYDDRGYLIIPKITNVEPAPEAHSYLTVTYQPTVTSADTVFYSSNFDATQLVSMEIDGVNNPLLPTSKRFTSTGTTCTVRYGFHENLTNCAHLFEGAKTITNVDVTEWDSSKVTDMSYMFASAGTSMALTPSDWDTSIVTDMSHMFDNSSLKTTNFTGFNVSNVTNMSYMFANAWSGHVSVNFTGWDTSKVTNMSHMFDQTSLSGSSGFNTWNVGNVTDMSYMFYGRTANQTNNLNLTGWDTRKVTNMCGMFYFCKYLQKLSGLTEWDVSSVTNMSSMFSQVSSASTIGDLSNWDVSNVTDMNKMFYSCSNLASIGDLSNWDVSKVTDMNYLFFNCSKLASIGNLNNWDVSKVTDMNNMFYNCSKLASIGNLSNWDVGNVTNMDSMFHSCRNLTSIGNLSNWDVSKVTNMDNMFSTCLNLIENLSFISENWDLSQLSSLTGMFRDCAKIPSVGEFGTLFAQKFDTTKINGVSHLFNGCSSLTSVGDFTNWSLPNCTVAESMFAGCSGITSIGDLTNLFPNGAYNYSYMFADCSGITSIGDLTNWRLNNGATVLNVNGMFKNCKNLTSVGNLKYLNRTKDNQSIQLHAQALREAFCNCEKLDDIGDIANYWGIYTCVDAASAFTNCTKFTNLGQFTSLGNNKSILNISHMFDGCGVLTSGYNIGNFSNWNTSAMTDMSYFLNVCVLNPDNKPNNSLNVTNTGAITSIGDISKWNVSKVTNMAFAFGGQSNLDFTGDNTFLNWNTSAVTDMSGMFACCHKMFNNVNRMNALANWNTSKVTDMSYMFYCAGLDTETLNTAMHNYTTSKLSGWTTSAVTNMREMFKGCVFDLTPSMKYWDVSNVTNMSGLFACGVGGLGMLDDSSLNNLSGWTTSSLTDTSCMFAYQENLFSPKIRWDLTKVANMSYMFEQCDFQDIYFYSDIPNVTDCTQIFASVDSTDYSTYTVYCPASAKSNFENKIVPNFPTSYAKTWKLSATL